MSDNFAGRVCNSDQIAPVKLPVNRQHTGWQKRFSLAQGGGGPGIDTDCATRCQRAGNPLFARRMRWFSCHKAAATRACFQTGQGFRVTAIADNHVTAGRRADSRGFEFGHHTARGILRVGGASHCHNFIGNLLNSWQMRGCRIIGGIGCIEPVNIG